MTGILQTLGPLELAALAVGLAVALLSVARLWQIGLAEDRQLRLGRVVDAAGRRPLRTAAVRTAWLDRLGAAVAAAPIGGSRAKLNGALVGAGFRRPNSLAILLAVKLAVAVVLALSVPAALNWSGYLVDWPWVRIGLMVFVGFAGWIVPDIALDRMAAQRRLRIELSMPDALDLLVISAEAGLSLSQAIEEIAHDLRNLNPVIAEEFDTTAGELRMLADRGAALENLARRTGIETLRGLISTLTQSIKFGTPLAESVRLFAAEMRLQRMATLEERAARLPVLLTLPMVGFIIPSLLLIIVGPVVIHIIDNVLNVFPNLMH